MKILLIILILCGSCAPRTFNQMRGSKPEWQKKKEDHARKQAIVYFILFVAGVKVVTY